MKISFVSVLVFLATVVPGDAEEAAQRNPKVVLDTSKGKIVLELFADKAPETVKNFLAYVDAKKVKLHKAGDMPYLGGLLRVWMWSMPYPRLKPKRAVCIVMFRRSLLLSRAPSGYASSKTMLGRSGPFGQL